MIPLTPGYLASTEEFYKQLRRDHAYEQFFAAAEAYSNTLRIRR